jgi:hypothetical protein
MFRSPCKACTARFIAALEHDKMLSTPAGFLADFCEHESVAVGVDARHGLVVHWSVEPCPSRAEFEARLAGAREALKRAAFERQAEARATQDVDQGYAM